VCLHAPRATTVDRAAIRSCTVTSSADVARPGTAVVSLPDPTSGFSLSSHRKGRQVVVSVQGELDAYTAPMLQLYLDELIMDQGNLFMELDLGDLAFIDSTGIYLLLQTLNSVRFRGGELTLGGLQPRIYKVFEICGLADIFEFSPSPSTPRGSEDTSPPV
jgi:anti-sigma B factor antagonist